MGRQRIILDNARWVGNVGWRQKEQTFDAGSVDFFGSSWKLSYDYLTRVQGITPQFNRDVNNHIVNLAFTGWNPGSLVAYAYLLDDEDNDDKTNTVGLRFNGSVKPGDTVSILYTAEYARQQFERASDNEEFNVDYYTLMAGLGRDLP